MRHYLLALLLAPSLLTAQNKLAVGSRTSPAAGDTIVTGTFSGGAIKVTATCMFSAGSPKAADIANMQLVVTAPTPASVIGPLLVPPITGVWTQHVMDRVNTVLSFAITTIHAGTAGVTYTCEINWLPAP